jgi:hemolysin D
MQVTAEVITHQRRLIEYFLSPLQQRAQESVRER